MASFTMEMRQWSWYFSCWWHHNILFSFRSGTIELQLIRPHYFIHEVNRLYHMVICKGSYCSFLSRLSDGVLTVSILQPWLFHSLRVVLRECMSLSALTRLTSCSLKGTVPVHGSLQDYSELIILNLPDQEVCWMCSDFSWIPWLP